MKTHCENAFLTNIKVGSLVYCTTIMDASWPSGNTVMLQRRCEFAVVIAVHYNANANIWLEGFWYLVLTKEGNVGWTHYVTKSHVLGEQ